MTRNYYWKMLNMHFSNTGISKDLTPQEVREEKEMEREAERRNKELSQDDRAKNLK